MKRLAIITYQAFTRGEGGGTRYAELLAKKAQKDGYAVSLIARSQNGVPSDHTVDGIRILELGGRQIRITPFWRVVDKDIAFGIALKAFLQRQGTLFDILHLIVPDVTWAIPRELRAHTVVSVIEDFWTRKPVQMQEWLASYQRKQADAAVKTCYRVTLPGETSLTFFQKRHPDNLKKLEVVYDFVDTDLFKAGVEIRPELLQKYTKKQRWIFVPQRAVSMKKVDTAIRALAQITKEFPDMRMLIAGGGPLEQAHQELAEALHIRDRITWLGMVSYRNDMPMLYRLADIVVITSSSEGAQPSPTASEAMAMGVLVVMTTACDTAGIFTGIVPTYMAGDAGALAKCVRRALKNPQEAETVAQEAKKIILKRFSKEAFLGRFATIYKGLTL